MNRAIRKLIVKVFIVSVMLYSCWSYADCQKYTAALQMMEKEEDILVNVDGPNINIQYRVAETTSLRAAGFQYVCPETIAKENILFMFPIEFVSAFHMNNVYAPLDIAFFDKKGVIIDIQTMYPYTLVSIKKPHYQPSSAAMYALETRQGFFAEQGIKVGAKLKALTVNKTQ